MTARTRAQLNSDADTNLANNSTHQIGADDVRGQAKNQADSGLLPEDGPLSGFRNALLNGAMRVAQRGTSFTSATTPPNSDDTYLLDRWILLSDGNDIVDVSQSTEAPTNGLNSIALDVETVNKKFGILQIIEQANCIGLIGDTLRLTFRAKVSATTKLDNLKAAIIAWSSTADAPTSDIISAWGVEGTNPTLAANWTYENAPANLSPTTSWAEYTLTALVDTAGAKNIGVFIWSDVTDTTLGDFLYLTDVELAVDLGAVTPFERRPYGAELLLCRRYFWKMLGGSGIFINVAQALSTTQFFGCLFYPVEMRAAPTITVADQTHFQVFGAGGGSIATVTFTFTPTAYSTRIDGTTASGLVAGNATMMASANAAAYVYLAAEL